MKGIIVAPQPEAVEAGADILADGGNAVDAAVACALTQTAVDPLMCGLAGFGSMHLLLPGRGHLCLDFHGRAPAACTPEMWAHLVEGEAEDGFGFLLEGRVNEIGYQSIMTPMTLRALATALERFGTRALADLLGPAIAYAEEGFAVRPHVSAFWHEVPTGGRVPHIEFVTRYPATAKIYAPAGRVPRIGETLRNPDMARTLRRIGENGVGDFYEGSIAAEIAADMAAQGGLLSAADLSAVQPEETEPLRGTYRGQAVATNPPPGGGIMLLEMLKILENFDLARMGHNSPDYIATVSEAMKIATVDKDRKVGDPRFVDVPVALLTSADYAAEMAARIEAGEKTHVPRMNAGGAEPKDTTHISVVDGQGNAVALTHSIGMPSGVVTEGLGFMYNGCMGVFDPRPGRAGSLAPGKARFTAMCPTILSDADGPWIVIGAPGGTFITMGVLQGILNMVDFGMTAAEAVAAPRFCTTSDVIDLTNRIPRRVEAALRAMGYSTRRSALSYGFAGVHALRRQGARWDGGADPGRDGMALRV